MNINTEPVKKGDEPVQVTKPFKYKTTAELKKACDDYFSDPTTVPWVMSELAYHLGVSRSTLLSYKQYNGYGEVIRQAVQRIEWQTEKMLVNGGPVKATGPIFVLANNFKDWHQKQEVNQNVTGSIEVTGININWTNPK